MKVRFMYRDIKGNKMDPIISGKLKENEEAIIKERDDTIPDFTYVLVYVGEDNGTFQNSLRSVGDSFDRCLINLPSIYPIEKEKFKDQE